MAEGDKGSFTARYFSDGTYEATYDNAKEAEPINGTWHTSDGFFSMDKSNPQSREYVGKVMFSAASQDGPCPWEGEYKFPDPVVQPDGSVTAVCGSQFRGNHYTGTPGGQLKVAEFALDPNSLKH